MESVFVLGFIFVPAIIALASLWGAIALFGNLDKVQGTGMKILMWFLIVALGVITFGIGSCYAMTFGGSFFRFH